MAATELGEHVPQGERPRHRVELVAALDQTRRRSGVEIGPEGDHQDVELQLTVVGAHPPRHGVDRPYRRLHEPHPRLDQVGVAVERLVGRHPAEHHVQLGEAEDEPLGAIDQHEVEVVAELLRERGGQL